MPSKEMKALQRALVAQGWRIRQGKHPVAYSPDGRTIVTLASTPSDHRAFANMLRELRRGGFEGTGR